MKRVARGAAGALIAVCALLESGDAEAFEFGTPASKHPYASPQNFALEFRFAPYKPQVDQEPDLHGTPFADSFGTNPRLYIGIEFDWQVYRIPYLGTIGPGLSAGIVGMSRPAVTIENPPRPSGDTYSLDIYPFTLSAVLRADTFWRDLGIPLVPYAKLGMGYAIWRASNSLGTSTFNGVSGKGSTLGTSAAVGLSLALDAIDPGSGRDMDNATGINNTYFFAEYWMLNLNGLGQNHALYVGSNSFALGMAFEF
jgi:hypothetical protein